MIRVNIQELPTGSKFAFLNDQMHVRGSLSSRGLATFVLISKKQLYDNWEIVFDPHPVGPITEISAIVSSDIELYLLEVGQ